MPIPAPPLFRRTGAFIAAAILLTPAISAAQGGGRDSGAAVLVAGEIVVLAVLLLLLLLAWRRGEDNPAENRGLGLPRGSVRSALALLIVGSTINFVLFGAGVAGDAFGEVAGTLGALSAAVVGFYFGGRTAAPPAQGRD